MTNGRDRGGTGGRGGLARLLAGVLLSALFLWATLRGLNLADVGDALRRVSPSGVAIAIPLVAFELVLRGLRWQGLLAPLARIPLRRTVAYLTIGYFANSMLPARLGDVARALLAGRTFGIGRLAVLGTIVVERLADGLAILAIVVGLGLTVAGGASLASTALWLSALAVVGVIGLLVGIAWVRRPGGGSLRIRLRSLLERVLLGATALRSPGVFGLTVLLTFAAFGAAVGTFALVSAAGGVQLTLLQSALVMGGLALSTSIPAAPGSIGTYEFVGLTILTALGVTPETALAVVVIVHLVATLPLALTGLVAAWQLHFRVGDITRDATPGHLADEVAA